MKTLILKRQFEGYYFNQVNNIRIVVSKFNSEWSGIITDESKNSEDYELFKCYGKTKKDVVNILVKQLI